MSIPPVAGSSAAPRDDAGLHGDPLWHVTITFVGVDVPLPLVRQSLERLSIERPFLMSGRYASDRAELRYWEEAPSLLEAAQMAVDLWPEHRISAGLPDWRPVGLEVLDRDAYRQRFAHGWGPGLLIPAGDLRPF